MGRQDIYDAIIIGAGHNGLTTAAYLARKGLRTVVFERRRVVGGCCVTEEIDPVLAPGVRVSTCSYIASMLRPEVIRDLRLADYGLRMIPCEPAVQAAFPDGDIVTWWNDRRRLDAEIERIAPGEAETFHVVFTRLKTLAACLQPYFLEPPPDTRAVGIRGLLHKLTLLRRMRKLNGCDIEALVTLLSGSLGDFLDRNFTSDKLKRLVLANSLYGKHGGPYQPGTAIGLLFHLLAGGEEQQQGWQGHVIGGMGAITAAMADCCRDLGVEIRLDSGINEIRVVHNRATGVVLENGDEYRGRVVVSNADPKRTFLKLIPAHVLDDGFVREIDAIKMDGPCAKVNLVLDREPVFTGTPANATPLEKSLYTLVPTLEQAEMSYAAAAAGKIAGDLWVDCVVPSQVDDSLVTAGRHVLTAFVQFLPWQLQGSDWIRERDGLGDRVVDKIAEYAPGVPVSIIARQVLTPLDLETEYGITEGNIFHGDLNLQQLFFMRPVPAWSQYATPVNGLYLCGAGTHPGGGVTGAPGFNAAKRVLRDFDKLAKDGGRSA